MLMKAIDLNACGLGAVSTCKHLFERPADTVQRTRSLKAHDCMPRDQGDVDRPRS